MSKPLCRRPARIVEHYYIQNIIFIHLQKSSNFPSAERPVILLMVVLLKQIWNVIEDWIYSQLFRLLYRQKKRLRYDFSIAFTYHITQHLILYHLRVKLLWVKLLIFLQWGNEYIYNLKFNISLLFPGRHMVNFSMLNATFRIGY